MGPTAHAETTSAQLMAKVQAPSGPAAWRVSGYSTGTRTVFIPCKDAEMSLKIRFFSVQGVGFCGITCCEIWDPPVTALGFASRWHCPVPVRNTEHHNLAHTNKPTTTIQKNPRGAAVSKHPSNTCRYHLTSFSLGLYFLCSLLSIVLDISA